MRKAQFGVLYLGANETPRACELLGDVDQAGAERHFRKRDQQAARSIYASGGLESVELVSLEPVNDALGRPLRKALAARHEFWVLALATGDVAARYPVDVASRDGARQAANRECERLHRDERGQRFEVLEIGAPDEIAPGEYARAIEAGYDVTQEETLGTWGAVKPDGEVLEFFSTERDAWDACDMHRMYGDTSAEPAPLFVLAINLREADRYNYGAAYCLSQAMAMLHETPTFLAGNIATLDGRKLGFMGYETPETVAAAARRLGAR